MGAGELFEHVVDAIGEAILAVDERGQIVMCNRAARALWGYPEAELLGSDPRRLFTAESLARFEQTVERQLGVGEPLPEDARDAWVELTGARASGETFPVELRVSLLRHGEVKLGIAVARDVSRRKLREAQLQESEAAFRTLIDSIFEGIFIHHDGLLLEANQPAADLTGFSKEELRGMRMALLTTESLAGPGEPEAHDVGDFAEVIEAVGVDRNGNTTDIEILTKAIVYRGQQVWVSAFRDVSAYKEKERELRRRLEAEDLISSISSRFINLDTDEMHEALQDTLARIAQFAGADRAHLYVFERDLISMFKHEWYAPGLGSVSEALKKASPPDMSYFNELLEQRRPHTLFVDELPERATAEQAFLRSVGVQSAAIAPLSLRHEVIGFLAFHAVRERRPWPEQTVNLLRLVADILANALERQRAQMALQRANEELERKVVERTRALAEKHAQLVQSEKMAALGQLVAGVAHEINTPLGAIKSNNDILERSLAKLGVLLSNPELPESLREDTLLRKILGSATKLGRINEEAIERIVRIVGSLRKFARLDAAEVDSVDLHSGIDTTLTLVHHELKGRIEVERDYGELPLVECYPNQLNQVFMNLLVNASQAIEERGTIRIVTRRAEGEPVDSVRLEFSDTGKGIRPEHLERIFDPGFTTKGVGVGTGLGLSIVHQLVRDHTGRIEVESEPGRGTTFRITLPVKLQQRPDISRGTRAPGATQPAGVAGVR